MTYDVLVVGSGPAGLMAAYQAAAAGLKTLMIDKNEMTGRKLLITGSKQCNLTSNLPITEFLKAYGEHGSFLKHALKGFDAKALMAFFEALNIQLITREDGKVFPKSLNAEEVVHGLTQACQKKGVKFSLQNKCTGVAVMANGFVLQTTRGEIEGQFLVLATGGAAYPHTGSSGEGYAWMRGLGLSIVEPRPALTPVFVKDYSLSELSGLSFSDVIIDLVRGENTVKQLRGDLLFTHFGLSGPVILNHARDMAKDDTLRVNFTGQQNHSVVRGALKTYQETTKTPTLRQFLEPYDLPRRLSDALLSEAGIDKDRHMAQWTKEQREFILERLLKRSFVIDHLGDFRMAMVTAGGVALEEINSKTMASKKIPNLYFAGEVMDIDGDTGGFNIQAAMSTAVLAVDALVKRRARG